MRYRIHIHPGPRWPLSAVRHNRRRLVQHYVHVARARDILELHARRWYLELAGRSGSVGSEEPWVQSIHAADQAPGRSGGEDCRRDRGYVIACQGAGLLEPGRDPHRTSVETPRTVVVTGARVTVLRCGRTSSRVSTGTGPDLSNCTMWIGCFSRPSGRRAPTSTAGWTQGVQPDEVAGRHCHGHRPDAGHESRCHVEHRVVEVAEL